MPNIMLTYRCNLNCSYCFANEFVHKENTDITVRNFMKAVDFLTREGKCQIGLIGGEPTLHPGFTEIMELLTANPRVSGVTVYTNGLLIDRFIPQVAHSKVGILVNCNSPLVIGKEAFSRLTKNLDMMMQDSIKNRIRLGINLYSDDLDYSYIMELLRRYDHHRVRISLTVPDFSTCGEVDVFEYFSRRKTFLLEFFHKMDEIGVLPFFDCNRPPDCIWTDEEKQWLRTYIAKYPEQESNLINGHSLCVPVIDILPNLQAVRCFGMSDFMKVSITDFRSVSELSGYFKNEIDSNAYKLPSCEACGDCYERKVMKCVPGCMGFKASQIRACNETIAKLKIHTGNR